MRIHTRISLLLIAITVIFLSLLFVFMHIRHSEIDLYLQSKLQSDKQVAEKVLEYRAAGYLQTTHDNAAWDGMVEFTKTKDTAWASVTMGSTYQTFGFDHFSVCDTMGNCLYTVKAHAPHLFHSDTALLHQWFKKDRLIHHFIKQDDQLWEVFGCVIVPTADHALERTESGYLIAAVCWDSTYIAELSKATGFKIELRTPPFTAPPAKSYFDDLVFTHDLEDFQGTDVSVLMFNTAHPYTNELSYLKYLGFIMIGGSCLSLLIFLMLINRWIAVPLRAVSRSLQDGQIEPINRYLKSKYGFGEISRMIQRYKQQTNDLLAEVDARTIAEDKFEAIFEISASAMVVLDKDTRIQMINDAFCRMSGYERHQLTNRFWTEFIPDGERERMLDYNRRRIADPQDAPSQYDFIFSKKDGTIGKGTITIAVILKSGQIVATFVENS